MPNPWMPGINHDPGRFDNYQVGRNRMEIVKVHATAGTDSYDLIKNTGLAQWIVPLYGTPTQFAPADGLCYDSGPYNDDGPGIEIERPVLYDENGNHLYNDYPRLSLFRSLSYEQTLWTGKIIHWISDEWGVPFDFYQGPRYGATPSFRGYVNHGDLDPDRSDGITLEEWNAMDEAAMRDLIDRHLFEITPYGISRFDANINRAVFGPQGPYPSRFAVALLDLTSVFAAELRRRLGL